jgi:molybdopterin-guanine dinucleotide biosynthesis adapter protein
VKRRAPRILAFSGPSGAGKTTLLVKLIPALVARGLRVAALKHSGHPHPFDRPGKDSARLRAAGALAVAVAGPREVAYFGPPVRPWSALARMLPDVDVVVAEGFKSEPVPRVEVHRKATGAPFLCARDRRVLAVVSDEPPPRPVPWFTQRDIGALADFVARFALGGGRPRRRALARPPARAQPLAREAHHTREIGMARTSKTSGGSRTTRTSTRKASGSRSRRGTARRGTASVREAGRKGGRRTLERRGPEFYSRIGRKGGKSSGTSRARTSRGASSRGGRTARGRGRGTTKRTSR